MHWTDPIAEALEEAKRKGFTVIVTADAVRVEGPSGGGVGASRAMVEAEPALVMASIREELGRMAG